MDTIQVEMQQTIEWEVTEAHCTTRGEFKVFSTPAMTLLVESTANQLALPHLKPGQGQVGVSVSIRHMRRRRSAGRSGPKRSSWPSTAVSSPSRSKCSTRSSKWARRSTSASSGVDKYIERLKKKINA